MKYEKWVITTLSSKGCIDINKQELSLKKDAHRSTNIIFFYELYFTEITSIYNQFN
jgi:hypothetical protein